MNDKTDKGNDIKINVHDKINVVETSSSGVSVASIGLDNIEREWYFPETVDSTEIATTASAELGMPMKPLDHKRFVEKIDVVKTYVSEFETAFGFQGFKLRIKREPKKKIIKSYQP